jgi:hypothetical protein
MIEIAAWIYVTLIEPLGIILFWLAIAVIVVAFVNFVRDPKARSNFINNLASMIFRLFKNSLIWTGKLLHFGIKMLLNSLKVIFAAVRDFWGSKI